MRRSRIDCAADNPHANGRWLQTKCRVRLPLRADTCKGAENFQRAALSSSLSLSKSWVLASPMTK
jgi:hypothetical protein